MKLPTFKDLEFLNKIRFKLDYYPFSYKYNTNLSAQLFKDAKTNGVSTDALNLISLGDFFHNNFYKIFTAELVSLHKQINISNAELNELFIAHLNLQELHNKSQFDKFLATTTELTAFDLKNAVEVREDNPDNPQNFTALSEGLVEFGNEFLRYSAYSDGKYQIKSENKSEDDIFNLLRSIANVTNKYYVIKDHYDSSLYLDGKIELIDTDKIYFDSSVNDLHLINQISATAIENQRLLRYHYYDYIFKNYLSAAEAILKSSSVRILASIKIESGFIKYELRKRTINDYDVHLDYQVSLHDYYPYYSTTPLSRYNHLTISSLLRLHSELKHLVMELYFQGFPEVDIDSIEKFKRLFLPKIRHSVLKSYLMSVTLCNASQVEVFIDLMTTKNDGRQLNLYSTHLIKRDDYYYFLFFPLTHPNYLYLIDYWLDEAGENLTIRGKALENYIKQKLRSAKKGEHNIFNLIDKSMFKVTDTLFEEIDLLIETKNTLIIGEIKCVKYPMYERDRFEILTDDVTTAVNQLNKKSQFLIDNQNHFKDIYSLNGKKIIKVIILNYPQFTGITAEDTPVIDANLFLSYFLTGELVGRKFDENDPESFSTTSYYSSEEEFCNNFESYLQGNPLNETYSKQLSKQRCSYKMDHYEIFFEDMNPIDKKSMLNTSK